MNRPRCFQLYKLKWRILLLHSNPFKLLTAQYVKLLTVQVYLYMLPSPSAYWSGQRRGLWGVKNCLEKALSGLPQAGRQWHLLKLVLITVQTQVIINAPTEKSEAGRHHGLLLQQKGQNDVFSSKVSKRLKSNNRKSLKILFLFNDLEELSQVSSKELATMPHRANLRTHQPCISPVQTQPFLREGSDSAVFW